MTETVRIFLSVDGVEVPEGWVDEYAYRIIDIKLSDDGEILERTESYREGDLPLPLLTTDEIEGEEDAEEDLEKADFKEEEHPRADDGKFSEVEGGGGGGAGGEVASKPWGDKEPHRWAMDGIESIQIEGPETTRSQESRERFVARIVVIPPEEVDKIVEMSMGDGEDAQKINAVNMFPTMISHMSVDGAQAMAEEAVVGDIKKYGRVLHHMVHFAPSWETRDYVIKHSDKGELLDHVKSNATYKQFERAFLLGWPSDSWNPFTHTMREVLSEVGPNKGKVLYQGHMGAPVKAVKPPENLVKHAEKIYENTQRYYAERGKNTFNTVRLYRGVSSVTVVHAPLESWTSQESVAKYFDGGGVLSEKVQIKDIWATWESLGDEWPEANVRGKKEHMVLGGSFHED